MTTWKDNYEFWINNAPEHVVKEISTYSEEEKEFAFFQDKEFGTAGIRGPIKYGTNHINEFVIAKSAWAYGKWLIETYGDDAINHGVVIAHDNRRNRELFSMTAAKVFSALGIKVSLYEDNELQPTPLLSFTIAQNDFVGGANITASHNPATDNGFKVYDHNGKQLNPSQTNRIKEFEKEIENIFEIEMNEEKISYLSSQFVKDYIEKIMNEIPFANNNEDDRSDLKITFTSHHGTSSKIANELMQRMNVTFEFVEEQSKPDENFTHSKTPNPQAFESFDLAKEYAEKSGSEILFGTDPDADRFGVVIKHNDKWVHINGNQLPTIQAWYRLHNLQSINDIKNDDFIIKSNVSTTATDRIAKKFNIKSFETLTGFKWIIERALKEEAKGRRCLFAYEESYGSVVETFSRDKDSFQALVQVIEMVYFYKKQGKTLVDVLDEIYSEIGYYVSEQVQIRKEGINGPKEIKDIIDSYKSLKVGDKFAGLNITNVIDYSKGYKDFEKENSLFIYLEDESYIALRPSGTEPMLRIYMDIHDQDKNKANEKFQTIKKEFLK